MIKTRHFNLASRSLGYVIAAALVLAPVGSAMADNIPTPNWAGYADLRTSTDVHYTSVSGSWTVPTITSGPGTYSGIWVGLDGAVSNTVEQVGMLADVDPVRGLEYYAFYELYPANSVRITSMNDINPGDSMFAQVLYNFTNEFGDNYTLSITDNTSHQSFSTTLFGGVNARSSAEWIVEAPSLNGSVAQLADFGSVTFTDASVAMNGNAPGVITDFLNVGVDLSAASGLNATAGPLDQTGTSFTVTILVPEPCGIALTALAAASLTLRRRRVLL